MSAKASLSNYRQAPRKVRLVANLIKGKLVEQALIEVKMLDKRAAPTFVKLINSAVANAKVLGMEEAALYIKELRVDKGIVAKRSMPRAFGRAFPIKKRSSHILVVLDEKTGKKSPKVAKSEKAVEEKPAAKETKPKAKTTAAKKVVAKKTTKTK